jgi:hypothetical protein
MDNYKKVQLFVTILISCCLIYQNAYWYLYERAFFNKFAPISVIITLYCVWESILFFRKTKKIA